MPAPAEIQAKTLSRFIEAWKKWSAEDQIATFADDMTQVALPFSLGVEPRSRKQVDFVLPKLVGIVQNYELTVHETIHDANKNKAAIYAMSKGQTPWGPWSMEYAVFITFSDSGEKIQRFEEMFDTAFMQHFGPHFQKYLQEQAGASH